MSEHFNLSLSTMQKGCSTAISKWKARVNFTVTMTNGAQQQFTSADAIIIRRVDVLKVHDYARAHASLRDYLIIRLPIKIGLRTSEIASLQIEDIDFGNRSFQVLDSKKHRYYPLPLDVVTLQLIQDLIKDKREGYVFTHQIWKHRRQGEPLTRLTIWVRTSRIGEEAGVKGYSPRLGRHYFAAEWHYIKRKNSALLRRILRHKSLAYTQFYLSRLIFFEDLQREYEQTQNPYLEPNSARAKPLLTDFYRQWCSSCQHEPVCRIIDQMCASPGATGCRYYTRKKEVEIKRR